MSVYQDKLANWNFKGSTDNKYNGMTFAYNSTTGQMELTSTSSVYLAGLGHLAIGAYWPTLEGFTPGTIASQIITATEITTATSGNKIGIGVLQYSNPAGASTALIEGLDATAATSLGNGQNHNALIGAAGAVNHMGYGTLSTAIGLAAVVTSGWKNFGGYGPITVAADFSANSIWVENSDAGASLAYGKITAAIGMAIAAHGFTDAGEFTGRINLAYGMTIASQVAGASDGTTTGGAIGIQIHPPGIHNGALYYGGAWHSVTSPTSIGDVNFLHGMVIGEVDGTHIALGKAAGNIFSMTGLLITNPTFDSDPFGANVRTLTGGAVGLRVMGGPVAGTNIALGGGAFTAAMLVDADNSLFGGRICPPYTAGAAPPNTGTAQALVGIWAGPGVPNGAYGLPGDYYFNGAPAGPLTFIYINTGGAWAGIV